MDTAIAIKAEGLGKRYRLRHPLTDENGQTSDELWALRDVSFEIKKGESVGIVGPNGCGKSTLLKILAGVTKPTTGRVIIADRVAGILDIGAGFHPELSGRENVFLNGRLYGFSKKEIRARFEAIVEFSGIGRFIDEPVKNYSNGMYLRLAFSIMAHLDFDVYLLDEVLSVGDREFRARVAAYLKREMTDGRKTFVIVTHQEQEALLYCSRIIDFGRREEETRRAEIPAVYVNDMQFGLMPAMPYTDESVTVSLRFRKTHPFHVALALCDALGNFLFSVSPLQSAIDIYDQTGEVHLRFAIPPNLFNRGELKFELLCLDESLTVLHRFFVDEKLEYRHRHPEKYRNTQHQMLKPLFDWSLGE